MKIPKEKPNNTTSVEKQDVIDTKKGFQLHSVLVVVIVIVIAYTSFALRRETPSSPLCFHREARGQVSFKDTWTQLGGG